MNNKTIQKIAEFNRPTDYGDFDVTCFYKDEHVIFALSKGTFPAENLLVRIQSPCVMSESFKMNFCDCGEQLAEALQIGSEKDNFLLIYLSGQEGRGVGIFQKVIAVEEETKKEIDSVQAFENLGLPLDLREYSAAAEIINELNGDQPIRLMTNNPEKVSALEKLNITIAAVDPLYVEPANDACKEYLIAKRDKMNHDLPQEIVVRKQ